CGWLSPRKQLARSRACRASGSAAAYLPVSRCTLTSVVRAGSTFKCRSPQRAQNCQGLLGSDLGVRVSALAQVACRPQLEAGGEMRMRLADALTGPGQQFLRQRLRGAEVTLPAIQVTQQESPDRTGLGPGGPGSSARFQVLQNLVHGSPRSF